MGFDKSFFNELSTLRDAVISPISPEAYRPSVKELHIHDKVTSKFLMLTADFVKKLYQKSKQRYHFSFDFRVYPQHICNFTKAKAFRKQLNVGFTAGDNESEYAARIGLGFYLNMHENEQGVDEYLEFIKQVKTNPKHFDTTFSKIGSYGEPQHIFSPILNSTLVLADSPDYNDDWRFYGKLLNYNDNSDILSSVDKFVDEVISVFNYLRSSGYY